MRNIHLTFVLLKNEKVCLLTTYTEINIQFNVVPVKSKVEISQIFLAFSEYMNFTSTELCKNVLQNRIYPHCVPKLCYSFVPLATYTDCYIGKTFKVMFFPALRMSLFCHGRVNSFRCCSTCKIGCRWFF